MFHFRRFTGIVLLILLFTASPALALTDSVDQRLEEVCVMSQFDDRFQGIAYNEGLLRFRGCAPFSVANAIIAVFGVTDDAVAGQVVLETTQLLVPSHRQGTAPADMDALPNILNPQRRLEEAAKCPALAQIIGAYGGTISFAEKKLTAEAVQAHLAASASPSMLVGRLAVNPSWEEAVRILLALYDAGQRDAYLCLAYAGAGTSTSSAPLRTGGAGHYLSLLIHVGSFWEDGSVYVLDSLPRALESEAYGDGRFLRSLYTFLTDRSTSAFNTTFAAARVNPTIIRLSFQSPFVNALSDALCASYESPQARADALVSLQSSQMSPLILFGQCVAIISLPET